MARYVANADQTIQPGQNAIFTEASIPCRRGLVLPIPGSGILTVRGVSSNPCCGFSRYHVNFNGNIAIPTGGTAGEISVALAIDNAPIQTTRARVTPAAVENFFNVSCDDTVQIPVGCCYNITVQNTSDQAITLANAAINVDRVA